MPNSNDPRQTLVKIVQQRGKRVLQTPKILKALLNDLCVDSCKVNALVTILQGGSLGPFHEKSQVSWDFVVDQIANRVQSAYGFNEELAYWAVESWAIALDRISKDQVSKHFDCPNCHRKSVASSVWRNSQLICPQCKSEVYFDRDLVPVIKKKGPRNYGNDPSGNWVLIDRKSKARTLSEQQLDVAITKILDDSSLSEEDKCDRLQLRRIMARLERQLDPIFQDIRGSWNAGIGNLEKILKQVLTGFDTQIALKFGDELSTPSLRPLLDACKVPQTETLIAAAEFTSFGHELSGVVFGMSSLYYCNGKESAHSGASCILYTDMQANPAFSAGLQEIGFGQLPIIISLAGSGISKANFLTLLRVISLVVPSTEEKGRLSLT